MISAQPAVPRRGWRRAAVPVVLAGAGLLLLTYTVQRVGWAQVRESLTVIGWWYGGVFALGAVRFAARVRAWQLCARPAQLPFSRALSATLSADALGNLTPLGVLASEPAKVWLVRDALSGVTAAAALVTENLFYIGSVLVMLGLGAAVFASIADVTPEVRSVLWLVATALPMLLASALLLARSRTGAVIRTATRVVGRFHRSRWLHARLEQVEERLRTAREWPVRDALSVACWEAVFHLAAVTEVWLVLQLLPLGRASTWVDALVLETAGRFIVVAFKFIPYRLGVDEAGSAIVATALGLPSAAGVSLALVRRMRVLGWNAVGVVLLLRSQRPG